MRDLPEARSSVPHAAVGDRTPAAPAPALPRSAYHAPHRGLFDLGTLRLELPRARRVETGGVVRVYDEHGVLLRETPADVALFSQEVVEYEPIPIFVPHEPVISPPARTGLRFEGVTPYDFGGTDDESHLCAQTRWKP